MRVIPAWSVLVMVSCLSPACGDDDDASDDPAHEAAGGASGKSGSGAGSSAGGKGGSGGTGGTGGKAGSAGSGGAGSGNTDDPDSGTGESGNGDGESSTHVVPCTDQSISQLPLFDAPNEATVSDESNEGGVIQTFVDTSAGATGGRTEPTMSFVYGRFTDDGFVPVVISDEDAFESTEWDIAVRRYVIRLNSGVAGPSNVTGARTRPNTEFAGVTSTPTDVEFRTEQYFTDSCDFVNDSSGINSPGTALASFWSYKMCVSMTHNVYVIALSNGRHVKFEVLSYYVPENQAVCDQTGAVPLPSGAGNMRFRWAFLD